MEDEPTEFPDWNIAPDFGALAENKPRRGRPPLVRQDHLVFRCQDILGFFEYHWSEVGWHISRAASIPKVREALRKASNSQNSHLRQFLQTETRVGSVEELAKARQLYRQAEAQHRTLLAKVEDAEKSLREAEQAIRQSPDNPKVIESFDRSRGQLEEFDSQYKRLKIECEELDVEVQGREAHYAQSELLDFIQSERHTLSPLSFAKAMAGLPLISWRQSAARLAKAAVSHPFESEYKQFCLFKKALGNAPLDPNQAVQRVKGFLSSKSNRTYEVRALRERWYFLRVGIERAYQIRRYRSSVPFLAFAEFHKRTMAPTAVDAVIARGEAIQDSPSPKGKKSNLDNR